MRNKSFFLTPDQILNQTKTVTRRVTKRLPEVGELFQPILKGRGLKKGEKVQILGCPCCYIHCWWEPLSAIKDYDASELAKEGFPDMAPDEFIKMFCKANKCKPTQRVARIEFEYTVKKVNAGGSK